MMILAISFSAYLLWGALGFQGMPVEGHERTHIVLSSFLVIALSLSFLQIV